VRPPAALSAAVLAAALAAAPARAERPVPRLTGPVVDLAGLLSRDEEIRLEGLCYAARAQEGGQGVQLQFLLVPSLEGEPIESFSIRVAEAWKIGSRGKDNGVLVVVSRDDRKIRVEVGSGIEGGLTDAQSSRIIRGTIAPAFRAGRYGDGLEAAGRQILAALGALPPGMEAGAPRSTPEPPRSIAIPILGPILAFFFLMGSPLVFLVLLVVFFVWRFGSRSGWRGGGWGGRGGWGGGGWSGGGGFGGGSGWSGGGGGFSGGGASGSW
jgi:uncharacterized protein